MLHFYSIKGIKLAFVDFEIKRVNFRDGVGFPFTTWLLPHHENSCASSPLALLFFIDKDILCMNLALQSRDADKQRGWGTFCTTQP